MNNLFNPKGKVDRSNFVINYLILLTVYIVLGVGLFLLCAKFHKMLILASVILFIIKVLIMFNYKKRIMDIFENLPISIILAIILAFDAEIFLPYLLKLGNANNSSIIFFASMVLLFLIPPAILAFIPSKNKE